jgi:hypothetical protein
MYEAIYSSANSWGMTAEFERGLQLATEQAVDLTVLKLVIVND